MGLEPIWENEDPGPDCDRKYWDEADWERFINDQDRKLDEMYRLEDILAASGVMERDLDFDGPENSDSSELESLDNCYGCSEQADDSAPSEAEDEPSDGEFQSIPAYHASYLFAMDAIEFLKGIPIDDFDSHPAYGKLTANCCVAGAKIAGGHGMGYQPDSIYGNVVKCRQAASSLVASIEALDELSHREDSGADAIILRQMAIEALRETRVRIEELRAEARRLHGECGS